jgi:DNA helicase MCM8
MATKSQDGLLEAMEQQQVSIAKAGVVASLPARCSVIAAANPKHGSYNMNKTVAENLNMSKPILSRFDLVFILRDRADHNLDRLVSSNIMNLYRERNNINQPPNSHAGIGVGTSTPSPRTYTQQNQAPTHPTAGGERIPVWERLAWVSEIQKTALPADLVRDYIAYAREYCRPKLTPEAAAVLKDYFMQLRYPENGGRKSDTVPITTRQLEALIRLSQARAKACLREFVLEGDALDVVELMRRSVVGVLLASKRNVGRALFKKRNPNFSILF